MLSGSQLNPLLSLPNRPRAEEPRAGDATINRWRALLTQSSLFHGLDPSALDDLTRRLQVRTRRAGALLVEEGEPGDAMFVVLEGRAKVVLFGENGREVTLSLLGPGDFFGEMALLDGAARSANVVADEAVTLLQLSRDAFVDHLRRHPQTAINLLGELSRRLRRADQAISDLTLCDVSHRLVRTLERLARKDGEERADGVLLRRRPTQQDLANMVGSCRETISRTFTSLVKQGLMVPRGRALLLTRRLLAA